MRRLLLWCFAMVFISSSAFASQDNFAFEDPARRTLFLELTEELRCPMCQNQNIADSDAMIAHDMRRKVYSLVEEGNSKQEVIAYMKARYGDFVHYQPPVTAATVWLWALPVLFALLAFWVLVKRKRGEVPENMAEKLKKADQILEREKP